VDEDQSIDNAISLQPRPKRLKSDGPRHDVMSRDVREIQKLFIHRTHTHFTREKGHRVNRNQRRGRVPVEMEKYKGQATEEN
jgi:hypothetical protein